MKFTLLLQKTIVATALACLVTPGADAQVARHYANSPALTVKTSVRDAVKANKTPRFEGMAPTDYGNLVVVMEEDFSKFATGSQDEPDMDAVTLLDYQAGECEYPWWNVKPEYTNIPHWGGANIFPAGGSVYMLESILDGQTHISTPLLDLTPYDGVCCIEFKAKTKNPDLVQCLSIEAAETNNMGHDWDVLGSQITPPLTGEWQKYTAVFFGARETTLFNIVPVMEQWWYQEKENIIPCEILFDDVKVYGIDPFVAIPKNLSYKNYKGEEFDLTWDAVDADSYIVNVWELDTETGELYELVVDGTTDTNSYHISDAFAESSYVFNVVAVKGDKKSFPSQQGLVCDLVDPKFNGVPEIVKDETTGRYEFTSTWEDVPSAMVYDYSVRRKRIAWYDHPFTITDEDFTNMQDPEGNVVEYTEENPCMGHYEMLPLKPLHQPGWMGSIYAPFKNFICLDGWMKIAGGREVYLSSPEFDLSKDNGKLHISVKLLGKIGRWTDPFTQIESEDIQTNAAISLYNYNEATGAFEQAEYVALSNLTPEWNTFSVDLTKGSARSFIVIEPIEGPEQLFIDDLKITQNYKKGEYFMDPCVYEYWLNDTGYKAVLPEDIDGEEVFENLCAQKPNPVTHEPIFSNTVSQKVGQAGDYPAGIKDAAISNKLISYDKGQVVVNNVNGESVNVYTLDGKLVYSNNSGAASVVVPVAEKGAYMVKVGNKAVKFSI